MLKNWLRPDFSNQAVLLYGDGYDNYKPELLCRDIDRLSFHKLLKKATLSYFAKAAIELSVSSKFPTDIQARVYFYGLTA